jgi:hypothetical protein
MAGREGNAIVARGEEIVMGRHYVAVTAKTFAARAADLIRPLNRIYADIRRASAS